MATRESDADCVTRKEMLTWLAGAIGGATALITTILGALFIWAIWTLDNYPTLRELDARMETVNTSVNGVGDAVENVNQRLTELRNDLRNGQIGFIGEKTIDGKQTQYMVVLTNSESALTHDSMERLTREVLARQEK